MQDIIPPPRKPLPQQKPVPPARENNAKSTQTKTEKQPENKSTKSEITGGVVKPPLWKRFLTSIFVSLTILSILVATITVWMDKTWLNTDKFVDALAPLAENPSIRKSVSESMTERILDGAPTQDLALKLIPELKITPQINEEQIREQLQPIVQKSVDQAIVKPEFSKAWRDALAIAHTTVTGNLESRSTTYEFQLKPVFEQILSSFDGTELGSILAEQKDVILGEDTSFVVQDPQSINNIKDALKIFNQIKIFILISPVLFFLLAMIISPDRFKSSKKIFFWTTIQALISALSIFLAQRAIGKGLPENYRESGTEITKYLFEDLMVLMIWIGAISLILYLIHILGQTLNLWSKKNTIPKTNVGQPK